MENETVYYRKSETYTTYVKMNPAEIALTNKLSQVLRIPLEKAAGIIRELMPELEALCSLSLRQVSHTLVYLGKFDDPTLGECVRTLATEYKSIAEIKNEPTEPGKESGNFPLRKKSRRLTREEVAQIKRKLIQHVSYAQLAKEYGCSSTNIHMIWKGIIHKDVLPAEEIEPGSPVLN